MDKSEMTKARDVREWFSVYLIGLAPQETHNSDS